MLRIVFLLTIFIYLGCAAKEPVFDVDKYVWPKESANPKIKAVRVIVNSDEFPNKKQNKNLIVKELLGDIDVKWIDFRATRMATDGKGKVYIVAPIAKKLQIVDFNKKDIEEITFSSIIPCAIDISKDGRIFLGDRASGRVVEIDKDKKVIWSYGKRVSDEDFDKMKKDNISSEGLYKDISDIFVYEDRIYVADQIFSRVDVLTLDGKFVKSIKTIAPTAIAINKHDGMLYVVSKFVGKLYIYDLDGNLKEELLQPGDNIWALNFPNGLAFDSENHIYIVDIASHGFKIYDRKGNFLYYMGDQKASVYLGGFDSPKDIVVDEKDRIYVLDAINRRLVVFQYISDLYKKLRKDNSEPEPMLRY